MGHFKIIFCLFFIFACFIYTSSTGRPEKRSFKDEETGLIMVRKSLPQRDYQKRSLYTTQTLPLQWMVRNPRSSVNTRKRRQRNEPQWKVRNPRSPLHENKVDRLRIRKKKPVKGHRRYRPGKPGKYKKILTKPTDYSFEMEKESTEKEFTDGPTQITDAPADPTTDAPDVQTTPYIITIDQMTNNQEPMYMIDKFLIRKYLANYNEGDFINIGNDLKEIDTSSFTFAALVKTASAFPEDEGGRVFSKRNKFSTVGFEMYCLNGEITVWANGQFEIFSNEILESEVWYLVTVVINRDEGTVQTYINGQPNGAVDFEFTGGIHEDETEFKTWVAIGSWNDEGQGPSPSSHFKGSISTVWTYDKDLNAEEVELQCHIAEEELPLFACR